MALLLLTNVTHALTQDGAFTYSYFGHPIQLAIETGSIAIPTEVDGMAAPQNLNALSRLPHAVRETNSDIRSGWKKLRAVDPSSFALDDLTAELIKEGVGFVSPVLKDDKGRDIFITQRIWVTLPYKMDADEKTRILGSIRGRAKIRLESSPVRSLQPPEGNPSDESTWLDFAGNPDGNELYSVEVSLRNGMEVLEEVERLGRTYGVAAVEPNMVAIGEFLAVAPPDDPLYAPASGGQWYLWDSYNYQNTTYDYALESLNTWERTYGYSSVKVAVIDSGIQTDHPDLVVSGGENFTDVGSSTSYGPTEQYANHGTAVAGVINATINNNTGIAGLAPNVRVYSLKVTKENQPDGSFQYNSTWIRDAINWCAANNVRVTNISLGLQTSSAISTAYANTTSTNGIVHFAATGNSAASSIAFPASDSNVIAIGATTLDGTRWANSNYGTGLELVAPGDGILTTDRTGAFGYDTSSEYIYGSGTSYASPLAAATAALILSKNPGLTPAQVKSAIKNTARYLGSSSQYGSGLLEPTAAIDAVAEGVFYAAGFTNSTGGWKSQAKFGWLVDEKFPYFHHKDHGEQYTSSTDPDNMWVYDYQSSSWWLIGIGENGLYPWIWKSDESTWYFYQKDTCCPRWFKNQITGQWVNF